MADKTIKNLAKLINKKHNKHTTSSRTAFIGQEPELVWNAINYYMQGGELDWVTFKNDPQNEDAQHENMKFVISDEFIDNMIKWFESIDPEIKKTDITELEKGHPYRVMLKMRDVFREQEPNLEYREAASRVFGKMFLDLLEEISKIDEDGATVHKADQLTNIQMQNQGLTISKKGRRKILDVKQVVQNKEGKIVSEFTSPKTIKSSFEGSMMHMRMVQQGKYRDDITQCLAEFKKPNNKNGQYVVNMMQQERAKHNPKDDQERPNVTVIGLGPAGVIAAIRAYQKGANVTAIEKREDYSRNNTFRFRQETIDEIAGLFLIDGKDLQKPINKLPLNHPLRDVNHPLNVFRKLHALKGIHPAVHPKFGDFYTITIKDFENLTNAVLDVIANNDPEGMKVYRGCEFVQGSAQTNSKEIKIKGSGGKITVPTDYLIGADGYNSVVRKEANIDVEDMSDESYYVTMTYHTNRYGNENIADINSISPANFNNLDRKKLKAQGWKRNDNPTVRFFLTGEHPYIGVDIPKNLYDKFNAKRSEWQALEKERDRLQKSHDKKDRLKADAMGKKIYQLKEEGEKMLDNWLRLNLSPHYNKDQIKSLVVKSYTTFPAKLVKAQQSVKPLDSGMQAMLVGDANHSAHFQSASGAVAGVSDGDLIGDFIEQIVDGENEAEELEVLDRNLQQGALKIHDWALHFPTGEDLKIRPTEQFSQFKDRASQTSKEKLSVRTKPIADKLDKFAREHIGQYGDPTGAINKILDLAKHKIEKGTPTALNNAINGIEKLITVLNHANPKRSFNEDLLKEATRLLQQEIDTQAKLVKSPASQENKKTKVRKY